jgi:NurA-like 5'-3' nuclease
MCEVHKGDVPTIPAKTPISVLLEEKFREEKRKTAECLADVQQFFSHDTSPTRLQLALALRQRAEVIEAEASLDRWINRIDSDHP